MVLGNRSALGGECVNNSSSLCPSSSSPEVPPHQPKGTNVQLWRKKNKQVFLKGLCLHFDAIKMSSKPCLAGSVSTVERKPFAVWNTHTQKQARTHLVDQMEEEEKDQRKKTQDRKQGVSQCAPISYSCSHISGTDQARNASWIVTTGETLVDPEAGALNRQDIWVCCRPAVEMVPVNHSPLQCLKAWALQ